MENNLSLDAAAFRPVQELIERHAQLRLLYDLLADIRETNDVEDVRRLVHAHIEGLVKLLAEGSSAKF